MFCCCICSHIWRITWRTGTDWTRSGRVCVGMRRSPTVSPAHWNQAILGKTDTVIFSHVSFRPLSETGLFTSSLVSGFFLHFSKRLECHPVGLVCLQHKILMQPGWFRSIVLKDPHSSSHKAIYFKVSRYNKKKIQRYVQDRGICNVGIISDFITFNTIFCRILYSSVGQAF